MNNSILTSEILVELKERVSSNVLKTKDDKLIKVWRIIGRRGLKNKSDEELQSFLRQATHSLRQISSCASHWMVKKEAFDFTSTLDLYEEKLANTPFNLTKRGQDEVLKEMNRLTFLQENFNIERYYVLIISSDLDELEQVQKWFKQNKNTYIGEELTFDETKDVLKEWYN